MLLPAIPLFVKVLFLVLLFFGTLKSSIETGRILKTFPEKGITAYSIENAFPLKGLERVIFKGKIGSEDNEGGYYLYDSPQNSIKKIDFPQIGGGVPYNILVLPFEVHLDQCK